MRVLHCIPSLGVGGSERQLALLSRVLARHGWEVHIAALSGGRFESALDRTASFHLVEHSGERDPRVPLRLARLMRDLRPSIVQTWLLQMDILGGTAALARAVPWVATERSSALGYPSHWSTPVRRFLVRRADALVANSAGGLDLWSNGAPGIRHIIRNALDTEADTGAPPLPDGIAVPDGLWAIVFAGRLVPEKRLQVLLQALARVSRDVPAVAILCGTGPSESALRLLARELRLDEAVIFAGTVRDIRTVLRRADVFVSVSAVEGSPNAVQEAMAGGTPVVLSDIPAHRELTDERGACFVDGEDPEAVARGLTECFHDRHAAHTRAAHAQSLAGGWSAATMGAQYDALYRQVLDVRRRR